LKFKSIRARVLTKFGAIIALILMLFSIAFYIIFWQKSSLSVKDKLMLQAEKIESFLEDKKELNNLTYTFIVVKNSSVIFRSKNFKNSYNTYLKQGDFYMPILPILNEDAYFKYHLEKPKNSYIFVVEPEVDEALKRVLLLLATLTPLIFLLLIFVANAIIKSIIEPINQLNRDAQKVNIDNFKSSLATPKYNDETALLTQSFNKMIARVNSGVERLKRANDTIAHELKTPISVMQTEIELALSNPRENAYYKESLRNILTQLNALNSLVQTLLILSRYSKTEVLQSLQECDFNTALIEVVDALSTLASKKNVSVDIKTFQKARKNSNCLLINTVMRNIIENAIKYSREGGEIEIELYSKEGRVVFIVKDFGIGIEQSDIPKLTERFFKVEQNSNKSYGLGLSIVKEALNLLNAKISIESALGKGSIFKVEF